jgi:hypothetical protein
MNEEDVLCMSTMECGILFYLKKEVMPFATTLMDIEDSTLCEIRQTRKEKYCMIL